MSRLCDKKILLLVYDEKMHRMVQYKSHPCFDLIGAQEVYDGKYNRKDLTLKNYTNDNYEQLTIKHLPKNYKERIDMNQIDGEMLSASQKDEEEEEDELSKDGDVYTSAKEPKAIIS